MQSIFAWSCVVHGMWSLNYVQFGTVLPAAHRKINLYVHTSMQALAEPLAKQKFVGVKDENVGVKKNRTMHLQQTNIILYKPFLRDIYKFARYIHLKFDFPDYK
ncbi:hypothetical protein HELRODRAFT_159377 [Helobdella robusta]|uniref:Uncharacterized protein n=1 Tax=Helobdella robusta TaxID=6412 RepID=T1ENZ1_HELRO|nr:hypothetical protein HELRODRAFT_159377 [Helobdella robusta]ESO12792.1 hypothetical protein HELRODRAFT_159377 [Helobdella robusta]